MEHKRSRYESPNSSQLDCSSSSMSDPELLLSKIKCVSSCRLSVPTMIQLRCTQVNEPNVHIQKLYLDTLPNSVLDLKKIISAKLNIPLICILSLSVGDMIFSDENVLGNICIRNSDEVYLEYFAMCEEEKFTVLVNQGNVIIKFCNKYLIKMDTEDAHNSVDLRDNLNQNRKFIGQTNERQSHNHQEAPLADEKRVTLQMTTDIKTLIWAFNFMYHDLLLPWKDENTLCHRLYLVQEDILSKIVQIWRWSIEYKQTELQEMILLVFWDFGENWIERIVLFDMGVHTDALDLFFAEDTCDYVKRAIIGMLAGYGEFPRGQKELGSNAEFLMTITNHLNGSDDYMKQVIIVLLFMLASCPCVPATMMRCNTLEKVLSITRGFDFGNVDEIEYASNLCMLIMVLLKSPDFILQDGIEVRKLCYIFFEFHKYATDDLLFHTYEEKQISWASDVPFLDLFFIPRNSPLNQFALQFPQLLNSYYKIASINLSAALMAPENRKLLLDENLYGYLIILTWREKNSGIKNILLSIMHRFKPAPYSIPSLLQIAIAQQAFNTYGLAAALELIS